MGFEKLKWFFLNKFRFSLPFMKFQVAEIDKHNLARGSGKKYLLEVDISAPPQPKTAHVRSGIIIVEKENGDPSASKRRVSTGELVNAPGVTFLRFFTDPKPQHFPPELFEPLGPLACFR